MITHKRKLRSEGSLWQHVRAPRVPSRALARDTHTDVLIVGAGITGALIAEALSEAGLEVIIVDRRGPVQGSTVASTALVASELDAPVIELQRKIGRRAALRAWQRSRLAVAGLRSFFRQRGLQAQSRDALYLAGTSYGARALRQEAKLRQAAGIETGFLDRAALHGRFGINHGAALLSFDNLTINPRAVTAQLLIRAQKLGARVYAPVRIDDLSRTKSSIVATDGNGRRIRCKQLVLATGYEFPKFVPLKRHRITTTFAFATAPQPRKLWPDECLVWEASSPYLYIRTTPDGRVLCGGEDERTSHPPAHGPLLDRKIARLQRKLGTLFPQIDTDAEFAWAAAFGETSTGLPIIGEIPGWKNCWAALGYGGNGITYSRIATDVIRSALTGEADPDADLYAFER
ncbi:MAG: FAD-binding oxidoreductase [Alphaproteobacteria bacterium]|nr:MAG: FAD-binding oxidoreductase [Alphaproteobacteria bacterium]